MWRPYMWRPRGSALFDIGNEVTQASRVLCDHCG